MLGLTVRWNAYRTIYYDNPGSQPTPQSATAAQELIAKLNGGGFQPNPARSMLVGVIGLWRAASRRTSRATGAAGGAGSEMVATAHARARAADPHARSGEQRPRDRRDLIKQISAT